MSAPAPPPPAPPPAAAQPAAAPPGRRAAISPPSRRDLLIGGSMAVAAAIAHSREPHLRDASVAAGQLEHIVPLTIGPWRYQTASGIVLPPPDALAKMLYDQQVARTYASETEPPVTLVMAYGSGQNGALQVHRPEICYPASGFRLTHADRGTLAIGGGRMLPIRSFTASSDTRVEQVLYWSRIGEALPTGWGEQRIAIMRSNLRGHIPDGLLVRVSTVMPDRAAALAVLERFCAAMLAAAGPDGRRKLVGSHFA